ncbi:DUF2945 domain-containing protein [Streptomyces sp. DSM 44915]|uniref:DUF2945 domain-containing protein n=1 Tax=Streptomyces chisholmiae TaxID=3075540 RepID=A0ABU2JIQ2_9ACTN|nr:DUF2945 domain-containing protein [Streptomyces sp. DSM 44915]MDT0264865.1 DUF2945 domain-containing protein [Streptomyces sp. DSM 44915]
MAEQFAVGDHVRWNSEAGYVTGVIIEKHTQDVEYHGHIHRCSEDEPQYAIRSDRTDHVALHRGAALARW